MSIVAAPWRRLTAAARWNGHAPHTATGAARVSASHCQYSNCSAGIIDISATGSDSAALISRRLRSGFVSSSASVVSGSGAGTAAAYPAASTVAMSCAVSIPSARTRAFSVV